MVNKTENTEEKIIAAARRVFIRKGMDGARMQEIANEAGINKALLHYYFRSKDKLFDRVFAESFMPALQTIKLVFDEAKDVDSFIEGFVRNYIALLSENPYIPHFILHEINRNPLRVVGQIKSSHFDRERIAKMVATEVNGKRIRAFDPVHMMVNLVALCVFPFVAQPIIQGFLFDGSEADYQQFIDERSRHIVLFVKSAIYLNHPQ